MGDTIVGTIQSVTLDGITFDVFPDSNIKENASLYKNEAVATSGANLRKMTKQVTSRESVVIAANGQELDILKAMAENPGDITLSYMTAAGDVYRAKGWIELENRETEENKATIALFLHHRPVCRPRFL